MSEIDIEAELPEDFDDLNPEEKVSKLEELKDKLDADDDAGALKLRIVEELISQYQG